MARGTSGLFIGFSSGFGRKPKMVRELIAIKVYSRSSNREFRNPSSLFGTSHLMDLVLVPSEQLISQSTGWYGLRIY